MASSDSTFNIDYIIRQMLSMHEGPQGKEVHVLLQLQPSATACQPDTRADVAPGGSGAASVNKSNCSAGASVRTLEQQRRGRGRRGIFSDGSGANDGDGANEANDAEAAEAARDVHVAADGAYDDVSRVGG